MKVFTKSSKNKFVYQAGWCSMNGLKNKVFIIGNHKNEHISRYVWYFNNSEDAMLFKLRFGEFLVSSQ